MRGAPRAGGGWRRGPQPIVVWFGDAAGHDPICTAISGYPTNITEASVIADLNISPKITVLAISVATPGLDDDPIASSFSYTVCGTPGGAPGQATRIAAATPGGAF